MTGRHAGARLILTGAGVAMLALVRARRRRAARVAELTAAPEETAPEPEETAAPEETAPEETAAPAWRPLAAVPRHGAGVAPVGRLAPVLARARDPAGRARDPAEAILPAVRRATGDAVTRRLGNARGIAGHDYGRRRPPRATAGRDRDPIGTRGRRPVAVRNTIEHAFDRGDNRTHVRSIGCSIRTPVRIGRTVPIRAHRKITETPIRKYRHTVAIR